MKKITDKKTGETFMGEVWIAEIKDGKRKLKVELKTEDDVDRYGVEDAPEEKKYGGRVPKEMDKYYYIEESGQVIVDEWNDTDYDRATFEYGNGFWTIEEAEKEAARRKAYVILKEDTKGFVPDWNDGNERKYFVGYNWNVGLIVDYDWIFKCIVGPYFATEEDAKASIKAHEKEWKVWLGVEV